MDVLSLPIVMVENILSYLPYDEIAKNRLVCQDFNMICQRLLNRGFLMIERRHALSLKTVKAQLPRRESERRCHPLARHCDILMSIETRISMLNMTYSKFIENGICCFIPGKVIDEIRRVLRIVETSTSPPRAHEVLQELRDISSMAIEHFDDKISPAFKKKLQATVTPHTPRPRHCIGDGVSSITGAPGLDQELLNLKRRTLMNAKLSVYVASQFMKMCRKVVICKKIVDKQRHCIRRLVRKQTEQEAAIAELKRRVEECDIKYSELTHTNQAAGGKGIAASAPRTEEMSATGQPLRHFASQIKLDLSVLPIGTSKRSTGKLLPNMKPRKPVIKLPSMSENDKTEQPPKKIRKVDENTTSQAASSSTSTPNTPEKNKTKKTSQSEESRLRKITKELQILRNVDLAAPNGRLGKRSISASALNCECSSLESSPTKIQKIDNVCDRVSED